ncbi:hypothetical protein NLJ89_g7624 [Agrocybe chaxingu]|uniref:Calcium-dependent phosphotriesterase n=1 Tax=Agrocybe chaxingu TaxID=84603 RepID=A0A9W8JYU5_9AGAR|nr:hypothetical protein NLJ89_g7624 [Agrocybe chaxingu]
MPTLHSTLNFLALLFAIFGTTWELVVKPRLVPLGYGRVLAPVNNQNCKHVPELAACEKIVLHQPSGVIYLACSTQSSRVHWTPAVSRLNASGASFDDYVATYDPKTSRITRLKIEKFTSPRGLSLHGMDIIPSSSDPSELFVYLVNHRPPLGDLEAREVGADSAIEIFKTRLGGTTLTHMRTVEDPIIITPNDVIGSCDGKSFYFTNDHGEKVGLLRELDTLGRASTSVGYCHTEHGCHYAIQHMHANNGIARAPNGLIYVANCVRGGLYVLEPQHDDMLVLRDYVSTDRSLDNLSVDSKGNVWAADTLHMISKHFSDPSIPTPSSALRFTVNRDNNTTTNGKNYLVEKLFEDDGGVASGITSVVYDAERNTLYLNGLASPSLTICKL